MVEYTFVMAKPDALDRGVVDEAFAYFRDTGLRIPVMARRTLDEETVRSHYSNVSDDVFHLLEDYLVDEEAVGAVLYGEKAVERARETVGASWRPEENPYGTIRGDVHNPDSPVYWQQGVAPDAAMAWARRYRSREAKAGEPIYNLVHAADPTEPDPQENAFREAQLFFGDDIRTHLE